MSESHSLYAHEVVPAPAEAAPLLDHTRYHVARGMGFWRTFMESDATDGQLTSLTVAQAQLALLLVALHDGLSGDEAMRWAFERVPDGGAGEWLYESGERLGIDMGAIKGFEVRRAR